MRKQLDTMTKHLTQEEIKKKMLEEEAVFVGNEQLETPPEWLVNKIAVNEWFRLVEQFNKKSMISNLDYTNLGAYCNAFARYEDIVKRLKLNVTIAGEVNQLVGLELKYSDEMRKYGALLGLTMGSRLQVGNEIIKGQENNIKNDFGDI